ncbi:pyrokinin-1 receptor isoform X2 [Folsomia candida]|uniref:pyrokinin-1 receptor isoform X2 n=1 Tax=Folsomia candida TaxID=158441 RepID=UPI0016051716|nr:pyrokinin-1 receptor isoform X2 [Folsomia candida]
MGKSILLSILLVVSYMSTFTTVLGDNMELETVDVDLLHDPGANLTMTFTTTTNLSINPGNLSIEELMKLELAEYPLRDPLSIAIPMTLIYSLILLSGLVGNVSTCIVIAKISYMHTATNYYLFSLAMSDLLLLTSGVPQEIYQIWVKYPYIFGEPVCVIRGLAAETSANATVLTITAFTVERFVAIVYPLKGHLLSQLSRVIRMITIIWCVALCMALPQAAQFGIMDSMSIHAPEKILIKGAWCALVREIFPYAFHISICVFFVIPMTLITVLYILIGLKLRRSRKGPLNPEPYARNQQSHVIRMLVAVVLGFFFCWSGFHAQRLMALYATSVGRENLSNLFVTVYKGLMHVSGILYYLSTCINPILYHIMSNKFRQAFRDAIQQFCGQDSDDPTFHHRNYSAMSRRSVRLGYLNHYKSGSNNSLVTVGTTTPIPTGNSLRKTTTTTTMSNSPANAKSCHGLLATIEEASSDKRLELDLSSTGSQNEETTTPNSKPTKKSHQNLNRDKIEFLSHNG